MKKHELNIFCFAKVSRAILFATFMLLVSSLSSSKAENLQEKKIEDKLESKTNLKNNTMVEQTIGNGSLVPPFNQNLSLSQRINNQLLNQSTMFFIGASCLMVLSIVIAFHLAKYAVHPINQAIHIMHAIEVEAETLRLQRRNSTPFLWDGPSSLNKTITLTHRRVLLR